MKKSVYVKKMFILKVCVLLSLRWMVYSRVDEEHSPNPYQRIDIFFPARTYYTSGDSKGRVIGRAISKLF